jgi:hypothetical protein
MEPFVVTATPPRDGTGAVGEAAAGRSMPGGVIEMEPLVSPAPCPARAPGEGGPGAAPRRHGGRRRRRPDLAGVKDGEAKAGRARRRHAHGSAATSAGGSRGAAVKAAGGGGRAPRRRWWWWRRRRRAKPVRPRCAGAVALGHLIAIAATVGDLGEARARRGRCEGKGSTAPGQGGGPTTR